ncbi:gustatory and pheromone receptor 39a-like isoform X2 [Cydia pomonella]|uniref:gustatory and pheromone receptor 39a-like isoform X2 n=1 Tax=Cydia pomonella TaxID=82600 RepID=UPI002ADE4CEA|nr:gustatory and pheromone receptor 39a-like isoform X2 [Cydia pomonella]
MLTAFILDILSETRDRVRIGNTLLTTAMFSSESFLLMLCYSIGVWTAPRQIRQTIFVLQLLKKVRSNLKGNKRLQYSKAKHISLILYIIWQIISYYVIYSTLTYYGGMRKNNVATARRYGHENEYIHQLNLSYDAICDTLMQLDKNNGPFLLCSFILLCMLLLITPYNLIAVSLYTNSNDELKRYMSIGVQLNWCLLHLSRLVVLVEPCHWLQKQMERTGRVLNKLVCHADRCDLSRMTLDPFLLQTQMYNCTLAPCGVFTITRPLLASVLGGVLTYLIIMVQFQNITEII